MKFCVILFITFRLVAVEAKWKYVANIIEVDWNITTENVAMEWTITRPSRGTSTLSGFIEFKEDINTDDSTSFINVYYSTNGVSYMLTAYHYPEHSVTEFVNVIYKNYCLDAVVQCCENPLYFEDKFVPPITKRHMKCNNFLLLGDAMPSHLRLGFYKIVWVVKGVVGYAMTILMEVEIE